MKVTVVGKEFIQGTSRKTGNGYAFIKVYYTSVASGIEGVAAGDLLVDPTMIAYPDIALKEVYDVDFDQRGRLCGFEPI